MSSAVPPEQRALTRAALAELGVDRLLLAIHGASFPADPDEDLGAGAPGTRAGHRLLELAHALGFTGLQLGPAGETSRGNPSPYDGTIFSRALASIPKASLEPDGEFAGLLDPAALAARRGDGGDRGDHQRAHDAAHGLVDAAWASFARGARPDLAPRLRAFAHTHQRWLERDALHAALTAVHGGVGADAWPDPLDATLFLDDAPARCDRRAALRRAHADAIARYGFGQLLAHAAHDQVRARARALDLALYADLQVGLAPSDAWSWAAAFLPDYVVGAPPSRTNADGQPWNYPVLDPDQLHPGGAALELVRARADKTFAEHDSARIDHPHGLVCPWVYRRDAVDAAAAVRAGARLYEAPDLPDHPRLARYAIATAAQLDRTQARHADGWVTALTPAQVDRYAILVDVLVDAAARHGCARAAISCEVLSTLPLPLARVLGRHHLGRWRVLQKANLDDATDVYRAENAAPADWVMLGNHDTPSIFGLIDGWAPARRARWAAHLVTRLALAPAATAALVGEPGLLAAAMLAEALASPAGNAMVFFADLFGYAARFNVPGTFADANWSLRLPAGFADQYAARVARGAALDLPLALALALRARGSTSTALITQLEALAGAAGTALRAAAAPG
ncbi:MAG: 4-alpha-glucanotransferase [Myxococcales bacterium]|nr:4-alpha-glucanotransferase [Myxococcales bacterium]